ncbi:MAG: ribose 5-phosphate isomerase B [Candidatus Eisenbacteria bacterium]|nr:ribose 5-phosphate isomerase B [Candidatus Eisenbacteria bacterium]
MKIAIAADHQGIKLKEALRVFLLSLSHEVSDLGPEGEQSVDYTDYGFPVAEGVASGKWERGILICKTGIGMSIVANKVPGVRAALCMDEEIAKLSREHNDSNVLVLAAMRTDAEKAKRILKVWLEAGFLGERHGRRIGKIKSYERERSCANNKQDGQS